MEEKVNPNNTMEPEPASEAVPESLEMPEETGAARDTEAVPCSEEQLAACRAEMDKLQDLYLRSCADLENFRKRTRKEKEDLIRYGNEGIIRELLPVLDNLERAVEHAQKEQRESDGLLQGVEMTVGQFLKALEKFGAVPFSALGETFDPARHEAMGQLESAEHPPNIVIQEMQKGCLLSGRLLRPAMVMVSRLPQEKSAPDIEIGGNDN